MNFYLCKSNKKIQVIQINTNYITKWYTRNRNANKEGTIYHKVTTEKNNDNNNENSKAIPVDVVKACLNIE